MNTGHLAVAEEGACVVAPVELQTRIRKLIDAHGVVHTANLLKVSRQTLLAAVANVRMYRGTIAQLTMGLQNL